MDGGVPQVRTRNPKLKQVHSEQAHAQKKNSFIEVIQGRI